MDAQFRDYVLHQIPRTSSAKKRAAEREALEESDNGSAGFDAANTDDEQIDKAKLD